MGVYKGISYPFRVGKNGGIEMSEASISSVDHILESIVQILQTYRYERTMEMQVYSDTISDIYSPNNASTDTLLSSQISEALRRLEPRIQVTSIGIEQDSDSKIFANIAFNILEYSTSYVAKVQIGESNG